MPDKPEDFEKNVFINCPFDDKYLTLLHPILFTIIYLGFNPRIALERTDSGEQRIDKICELIEKSKYSIHDLSRLQATKRDEYFRLNMPFELGIDYGVRKLGSLAHRNKKFLILSKGRFDYAKAISDLSGIDIRSHEDEPIKTIRAVRGWLKQYLKEAVPAPQVIWGQFNYFLEEFHVIREAEGFSKDDVYEITSSQLNEFIDYMRSWVSHMRDPIGPGLGATAKIIDGSYYCTSSTPMMPGITDLNLSIRSGEILRNMDGKLVGYMIMRSPKKSVQRIIEKSGGDKETFFSDDSRFSTDANRPTIFKASSELIYVKGDKIDGVTLPTDIKYKIDTVLQGYLEDMHFKGKFQALWKTTSLPSSSFSGVGSFDIQLR